ncbi:MAG TPA: hypothetical protein VKB93_26355 [Thermoanaerobaculia bacterium]|nr:hypothetical protein [Thermoanaerobaculia bacterium]
MRSRFPLILLLVLFGCALTPVKRPWKAELTTGGGFTGQGTGSITLDSGGAIHVTTPFRGACEARASAKELARFEALLGNARPQKWRDSYMPKNRCCDRVDFHLTLTIAEQSWTAEWMPPEPMPKDLSAIGDELMRMMQARSCKG